MNPGQRATSRQADRSAQDALLAHCFAARTVHDLADALIARVRDAMPAHRRDPAWLGNTRRRLARAIRGLCLVDLCGHDESTPEDRAAAEHKLHFELGAAVERMMDAEARPGAGAMLTRMAGSIALAARGIAGRCLVEAPAPALARLQSSGAPPALLCRLDGHVLGNNGPLEDLCRRRQQVAPDVGHDALAPVHGLARDCLALGGTLDHGARKSALGPRTGLHLSATLQRHSGDVRAMYVEVRVSEALRQTRLTARELQIARLLVLNGSYADVAAQSGIALDTVRTHVRRLYRKLAVHDQEALRQRLRFEGLLPEER